MFASRAQFGGFVADVDMAAVTAFPALGAGFDVDFTFFHIFDKFIVTVFVPFFDFGDACEEAGEFAEAFLFGDFGKFAIHFGPFFVFAGGGGFEVIEGIADTVKGFEPEFGVFFFVIGGRFKDSGDLFVTVFACFGSEV